MRRYTLGYYRPFYQYKTPETGAFLNVCIRDLHLWDVVWYLYYVTYSSQKGAANNCKNYIAAAMAWQRECHHRLQATHVHSLTFDFHSWNVCKEIWFIVSHFCTFFVQYKQRKSPQELGRMSFQKGKFYLNTIQWQMLIGQAVSSISHPLLLYFHFLVWFFVFDKHAN